MQGEVIAVSRASGWIMAISHRVRQKGDKILFTKYAPDEVEIDGDEYLVIDEEKILAIVRD